MAIYHLSCSSIGRKDGRSVTAAAAYRSSCVITDRTTGERHDYTRKKGTAVSFMLLPENAPSWANDREDFWNRVEEKERRSDSELAKSFDIALPKELSQGQNVALIKKWVKNNYGRLGLVADVAIHSPHKKEDGTHNGNWHAHVLVSTRGVNKDGWEPKKEAAINGKDRVKHLENARKDWADIVNQEFERLGLKMRIDHRSLEEQGITRQPQQHMGVTATAMARKGKETRRGRYAENPKMTKKNLRKNLAIDAESARKEIAAAEAEQQKIKAEMEAEAILRPAPKPAPVQRSKEQVEMERQAAIVNRWDSSTLQTYLYGDAGTPGTRKNLQRNNFAKAQAMYVERHSSEIATVINSGLQEAKAQLEKHEKTRPCEVAKKGNWFMSYRDSNGKEFSKYDEYKASQEQILRRWKAVRVPLKTNYDCMNDLAQAGKSKNWPKLAQLIDNLQDVLPDLAQKVRDGAEKLLQTAAEFLPYRSREAAVKARRTREAGLRQARRSRGDDYGY